MPADARLIYICLHTFHKQSVANLSELVQVKQTMARIKGVLSERAYAESTPEARAAALDKVNAR